MSQIEPDYQGAGRVIDRAVRTTDGAKPAFYAITGSHLYGFPSEEGGDVDVRGFHVAPGERYLGLNEPKEQIQVNQGTVTQGFEEWSHVDLVSYELKKFGQLLFTANYNVIELVFHGDEVINGVPLEIDALRSLIAAHLPMDVPKTYLGMAKSNYWKYLNPEKDAYRPTAKKFLYVLRGLYAAKYVARDAAIEPDVVALSGAVDGDTPLINSLIETKRSSADATVPSSMATEARDEITDLFNEIEPTGDVDKAEYRDELTEWMLKVRQ
jgi:predicted nucleotidyltransferase